MKLPSLQFYPGDWKKDPGIQCLSLEEKGAWFEMLLAMFESPERGYLLLPNGAVPTEDMVGRMIGCDQAKLKQVLSKLLSTGVASEREGDKAIFCRRMVRDNELRQARAEAGSLGGKQRASKASSKPQANSTPSSSSSSSSSSSNTNTRGIPDELSHYQKRLNFLFRRKDITPWSDKEIRVFKEISKRPEFKEELSSIEKLYSWYPYKRRDLGTLLNNWTVDLDRARNEKNNTNGNGSRSGELPFVKPMKSPSQIEKEYEEFERRKNASQVSPQ